LRFAEIEIMDMTASTMTELEDFARTYKSWFFRGHRCPEWKLETSLERASRRLGVDQIKYEKVICGEFKRHVHSYLPRVPENLDTIEWLSLMQHYGAPTRLLDFTQSFWIALFFAIEEAEKDCAIVALNPSSLAANIPGRDYNKVVRENIDSEMHTDNFLRQTVPFYTNERLAIQKGIFVYSLNLRRSFHDLMIENQKELIMLTVSMSLFSEIRYKLNDFNCNSRVLFPGIDGYSRYFKNHTY
jgi:FRG domain